MDISEAVLEYRELGKQYFAGDLSEGEYHAQVRKMHITGDDGERLRINSTTGTWERLEDGQWHPYDLRGTKRARDKRARVEFFDTSSVPMEVMGATFFIIVLMLVTAGIVAYSLNVLN